MVDAACPQTLLGGLCRLIAIANSVIDTNGVVITRAGGQEACVSYHRVDPRTRGNCVESDTVLAANLLQAEAFAIYGRLCGLVDSAMAVVVDGRDVANILPAKYLPNRPTLISSGNGHGIWV